MLQKDEFERSLSTDNMDLYNNEVLVLWKWHWNDEPEDSEDPREKTQDAHTPPIPLTSDEEQDNLGMNDIIHSVVFKCIGASRDYTSQETAFGVQRNES